MILFLDDWKRYPTASVHLETKNESFLFMTDVYRVMGLHNHLFHLALINPELRNVDPHDPDLDITTKAMVKQECKNNFWYYLREVVRIPGPGDRKGVSFIAHRGNIAAYWCFLNHVDYILILIRQGGKSTGDDVMDNYIMFISGEGVRINKLTKNSGLRSRNIQRLKEYRDALPPYLNPHDKRNDKDNNDELSCVKYGNQFNCYVGQSSEIAADKVARGETAPVNRSDEGPFTSNSHISIGVMVTTGTRARDDAAANGSFYCTTHTTTAGKINTKPGEYMYNLKQNSMYFTESLYDCVNEKHLHRMVRANSKAQAVRVNITMNHLQLGYDDKWMKRKLIENNVSGEEADRDFFNRWTNGGISHPLDTELVNRIVASKIDAQFIDILGNDYIINWYVTESELKEIKATRKIIIGHDNSQAINSDSLTLVFIDSFTGDIIAGSNISEANIYTYIDAVAEILISNPSFIFIPERRSTGQTIIDGIIVKMAAMGINPLYQIYNTLVDSDNWMSDKNVECRGPVEWWSTATHDLVKKSCGYATSASGIHSRSNLYKDTLKRAAAISCDNINDARLIDEIATLTIKNDRIDHPSSGHDDMVVAWLLAFWMLLHSRNLKEYGIINPLSECKEWVKGRVERDLSPQEQYEIERAKSMKIELEGLTAKLEQSDCPYTSNALERLIRRTYDRIGPRATEMIGTVDELIRVARDKQKDQYNQPYHRAA